MGGAQLEKALDLIDANLRMNKSEVLQYIEANMAAVGAALRTNGRVDIPTSAGVVTLRRDQLVAA
jgi:hypothetical protein